LKFLSNKPVVGWIVVGVLAAAALWFLLRGLGVRPGAGQLTNGTTRALATEVEIKDRESGETWTMHQGQIERELWTRESPLDPNQGLLNPKTGKLTGFPTKGWEETIKKIDESRASRDHGTTEGGH